MKRRMTDISVTLTGMPKCYQVPARGGQNVSSAFLKFYSISQWTWPLFSECDPGPCLVSLCVSSQKPAWVCAWMARRWKYRLFELGAVQTQTVHGSLCRTESKTNDPLTLQTLPAVQREVNTSLPRLPPPSLSLSEGVRACVCARAIVPVIAAVRYKYEATPWANALCLTFTGM